jgi:hypothetical protein
MDDLGLIIALLALLATIIFLIIGILSIVRKNGKAKKQFRNAGISFVLMIIGFVVFGMNSDPTETATPETVVEEEQEVTEEEEAAEEPAEEEEQATEEAEKEVEKTPQQKMLEGISALFASKQAFDTGSYIKGDIPPGEYAFVSFAGSGKYYSENDASNNIIDNNNFDSFGYVFVHGAGNIETQGVLVSTAAFPTLGVTGAKQIYEILNNATDYKEAGFYKVGTDIPAGSYVLESYGDGYAAVLAGPIGKSDIVDNELFNGRYSVNISNGQYLQMTNSKITQ